MPAPTVRVLLIPAAGDRPCQVTTLEYSAVAFSDAIGGGLLADIYYGNLSYPARAPADPGTAGRPDEVRRFCFYADEDRVAKQLPANPRAGSCPPGWPASVTCGASRWPGTSW